jgi:pSer/pThr/pTyr-binding forkhead associated (FHA) protein
VNNTTGSRPVAARAYLICDRRGHAYPIGSHTLTIGRDSVSHVVVSDPSVSRFHAEVRVDTGGRKPVYTFLSMGSRGSAINGTGVTAARVLDEGDEIVVGDTMLRFTREQPAADFTVVRRTDAPADPAPGKPTVVMRSVEPVTTDPARPRRRIPVAVLVAIGVAEVLLLALIAAARYLRHG